MGFKEQTKKVVGCSECRLHALCMYCLGLVDRPQKTQKERDMTLKVLQDYARLFRPSKEA